MLGITVPDAIAFGTLVIAVLAAWKGTTRGEAARSAVAPGSVTSGVAGAFITAEMIEKLIGALEGIGDAIRDGNERKDREHVDKLNDRIERLMQMLDHRP